MREATVLIKGFFAMKVFFYCQLLTYFLQTQHRKRLISGSKTEWQQQYGLGTHVHLHWFEFTSFYQQKHLNPIMSSCAPFKNKCTIITFCMTIWKTFFTKLGTKFCQNFLVLLPLFMQKETKLWVETRNVFEGSNCHQLAVGFLLFCTWFIIYFLYHSLIDPLIKPLVLGVCRIPDMLCWICIQLYKFITFKFSGEIPTVWLGHI